MTLRVMHIITGLGRGGAEAVLYRLVCNLDRENFACKVVSLRDDGVYGPLLRQAGVPVIALGMKLRNFGIPGMIRLIGEVKSFRPQLIQTWLYHADLAGLVAGAITGRPAIVWNLRCADMDMSRYSFFSRMVRWLGARFSSLPQAIVVNSEAGRKFHAHVLGYRPQRWELIGNGFNTENLRPDPDARAEMRRILNIGAESIVIGMVARFDPMKDHSTFLQAAAVLRRTVPDVRFILVGQGVDSDNGELMEQIDALQLADVVHLLGQRNDVAKLITGFDVATLASRFGEGFPNVIGEAMSCAVPCVVTDVGDSAMVVGDTGFVVPVHDPDALAHAWWRMIELGGEGRRHLGEQARQRIADHYSIGAMVSHYSQLYEQLTAAMSGRK